MWRNICGKESKISWGNLRGLKNLSGLPSLCPGPFANTQLGHQTSLLQTRDNIAKIFGLAANVGSFYPFHLRKLSEEIKVFRNILRGVINLTWHCALEVSFESIVKFLLTHSRLFLFPSGRKWACGWEPGRIITVIDSWPRNMLYSYS